ncbi:MAG: hypothetical protein AB8B56_06695 [Crocinitomicaceae bacterium]
MLEPIIIGFLVLSTAAFGQETSKTPYEWQRLNPRIVCMQLSEFNGLSPKKQNVLKDEILLFEGELDMVDIEKYESEQVQNSSSKIQYMEGVSGELKTWVFYHPEVKIIPRSRYNAMGDSDQQKHIDSGTLILKGEVLTLKDIQYYEENN